MKFSTKQIAIMSVLIAMAVILRRFLSIQLPFGIISFGAFPIIISGFIFGPVAGGIVGALSDIAGYPFFPKGPYFPHFTLTSALTGIIPVLILRLIHRAEGVPGFVMLLISIFIGQLVTTVILVPYFLEILLGIPFWYRATANFIIQMVHIPIYAFFSFYVLRAYTGIGNKLLIAER